MLDNPHITPEAAEDYLSGLDDDERKAREHGTYVQLGGLVYKQFSIERHVVPIQIPQRTGYGMSRLTTDSIIRQVYSGTRYLPKILSLRSRNITKENERLMRTRQRLKQRTKRSAKNPTSM